MSVLGLATLAPGSRHMMVLHHADGGEERAALNLLRASGAQPVG